ncbi:hypothetical protein [Novosphingobium sp.]|uniref:hypothetical protein n=1 Tax=Novosphingobium sp. TaxID=1874826 RepID=UPI0026111AE1|nr:hypothetical protein [Novosphingobium sp.]
MLGLIIMLVLLVTGFEMKRFDWRPFAVLAVLLLPLVLWSNVDRQAALKRMGEDTSVLWTWQYLSLAWFFQWLIDVVILLIGFAAGKVWRRRRARQASADNNP